MSERATEHYVAYHGWAWLKNAVDSHRFGLRVALKLCDEEGLREFKNLKKRRKNRAGSGEYRFLTRKEGGEEWYGPVDMIYVTWSHSISNGVVVTFELNDPAEWRKMRDARALDAGYEEHQLDKTEFIMLELDDNGAPINIRDRAKMEKMAARRSWPKGGARSIQAARLCQDKDFLAWLQQTDRMDTTNTTPAGVAMWMREDCDIDSRAQLDHDPAALARFEERIYRPFLRSQM